MIKYPTKIFPCDCMGEGLVAVHQEEDMDAFLDSPYIEIAFWQLGHEQIKKYTAGGGLWWRLVLAWRIFRHGMPFADMVIMKEKVAKNFAHHILYLIEKDKERKKQQEPLVKLAIAKGVSDKIDDGVVKFLGKELPVDENLCGITCEQCNAFYKGSSIPCGHRSPQGHAVRVWLDEQHRLNAELHAPDMSTVEAEDCASGCKKHTTCRQQDYKVINDGKAIILPIAEDGPQNYEDAAVCSIDDTLMIQLGVKEKFCYNHGGDGLDGRINRDDGFDCPKCVEEENYPMLCVQHGGSAACEAINKKYGHECPKCAPDNCELCKGQRGNVRGNENIFNPDGMGEITVCDNCHAELLDAGTNWLWKKHEIADRYGERKGRPPYDDGKKS